MQIGDRYELRKTVTPEMSAEAMGSGALPVFATPMLVSMMENAGLRYMQQHLPSDKGTVGTYVSVNHTAATPIGMEVRVIVEVTGISENGKMVDFKMSAFDEIGPVGSGLHQRAIVSSEKFLAKAEGKLKKRELKCPVCGEHFFEEKGAYEICPVCKWEDDPSQRKDPDMAGGANHMSLNEAIAAYRSEREKSE